MAGTVTVGCKHPHGFHLDLVNEDGSVERHTLKGNAAVQGKADTTIGGYALSTIPADFWDAWIAKYGKSSLISDGIIFAMPKPEDAKRKAIDGKDIKNLNPKTKQNAVKGVTKADKE